MEMRTTPPPKGTPSLSSPKSSAVPDRSLSGSRESNENEQPLNQKPMTKNFMSPTISAASKASIPIRKKILAERNELSTTCESLPHKASNVGSKTNSLNSTSHRSGNLPISTYSYASESDNDQENNSVVDSSYKPYDPLTNDLGPRPKYLRYQPNRRRGTFLDPKKSDEDQGSLQQTQDPSNLPEISNLELENDEDVVEDSVEDDEEEMEEDVDREWSLKGVFKVLLLLAVFFLSGSNLSTMDSAVSSDSGAVIRKNIFEAVFHEIYGSDSAYVDQPEYSQSGFLELCQRETNNELKAVEFVEDTLELLEVGSAEMEETTQPQEEGVSADVDINQDNTEVEVTHSVVHGDAEEETMSTGADEVTIFNEVDEAEVDGFDEQLQRDQVDKNDPELENLEVLLDDISSSKFELAEVDNNIEQLEKTSQEQTGEVEIQETVPEGAEEIETEVEISNFDSEIESENAEVKEIGLSNAVIVVGVSAASALLAMAMAIIYVTRKPNASIQTPQAEIFNSSAIASVEGELLENKNETSVKVSSLQEPLNNPSENRSNSHLERIPAIESITQASSLCGPTTEASKEISHFSAPKIELLGEMMVGEVNSSLRSCVRKNNMIEAEGSNINISKGVVLPPAQPSVVETDSPSYGSFTTEKKILKKKVEKDREEIKKVVLTTPVRRSSRIRDRIGMSP
ncbi:uncharacterized protein LOC107015176 [Solanum pennellii]|uniref:Uncharacterized protein LOC107015176 n=1 Tax=Solanum pennellii TaxID=28526 RepID=A0ABM1GGR2_SOLPN|nr:uncharacterized protein LOC107015176 [Solanum pennellii]